MSKMSKLDLDRQQIEQVSLPKIEHAWIEQEAPAIIDLLRNIAGLDNGILYISSHANLVGAVQEWRAEARKILDMQETAA